MFEFIKRVLKREEPKRIPGVTYAEVDRVPIKRIEVQLPKSTVEKIDNAREKARNTQMIWRYQYTDTGEIVEKPNTEAIDEILNSNRPVKVLEHFVK